MQKSSKPCIRYMQPHKDGTLYIQFNNSKSFRDLADTVIEGSMPLVTYIVRNWLGKPVIRITGLVVKETKAGKVTYRTDKEGNVHLPIGRVSFDDEKLVENFKTISSLLVKLKPSSAKGTYMKNVVISSTMGPSVKVQVSL